MNRTVTAWFRAGLSVALAFSLYSTAQASTQQDPMMPHGTVTVNGDVFDFSSMLRFDPQSGLYIVPLTTHVVGGQNITFGVMGDPDPVLSYSFSATNNTATAVPFAFDLSIPIMAVPADSAMASSLGVTLTDGNRDGAAIAPFATTPNMSSFLQTSLGNGSDLGVGSGGSQGAGKSQGVDIGAAFNGVAGRTSVTNYSGDGISPFAFSNLGVHLSFLLSPNGDNVGMTGSVEVAAVPEPGTVAMLAGMGLSGVGFLARRRRAARKAASGN